MFIKIYFNEIPVVLTDSDDANFFSIKEKTNILFLEEPGPKELTSFIKIVESTHTAGMILTENFDALKKLFFSYFKIIKAGGGLVINPQNEILLIFRRGKWDLPKGKLDENEDIEECALREVTEETGLDQVKIKCPLQVTYHTYFEKGHNILKESHWYIMNYEGFTTPIPQLEEQITEVKWVNRTSLPPLLKNTYPIITELIELYLIM